MTIKTFTQKLRCKNCKDEICSRHGGDWVACKCFESKVGNKGIYMDRDRWMPDRCRIGNYEGAEWVKDED